jgi:hypothetical protein
MDAVEDGWDLRAAAVELAHARDRALDDHHLGAQARGHPRGVHAHHAAAQANFHVSAQRLSEPQAARLAAIVPKPLSWKAARPGPYIARRGGRIVARAGVVARDGLADCVLQ